MLMAKALEARKKEEVLLACCCPSVLSIALSVTLVHHIQNEIKIAFRSVRVSHCR